MTHPGGRPTAYKPEYCETVIELGKLGKSQVQMAANFDIARDTLNNWADANPEFLAALNRAKAHAQDWWENAGQSNLAIPGFNAAVWKKSVEARFREDYTERKEVSGPDGGPIATDNTHNVALAISDSAAFIADALRTRAVPAPKEPGEE